MFYDIIQEITKVTKNSTIYKEYGEEFYELCYYYTKDKINVKDKQLYTLRKLAETLDVPVKFIIGILDYEGVDELDKTRGASNETSGN